MIHGESTGDDTERCGKVREVAGRSRKVAERSRKAVERSRGGRGEIAEDRRRARGAEERAWRRRGEDRGEVAQSCATLHAPKQSTCNKQTQHIVDTST